MRFPAAALFVVLLLTSCGGGPPIPELELHYEIVADVEEVESGRAFRLTVTRIWSKALVPQDFDEGSLAPLALRLESTTKDADEGRIREVNHYRAYAFTRDDIVIPAPKLVATPMAGGAEQIARAPTLRVRVVPSVDALDPGEPELPTAPAARPSPSWPYGLAALFLATWIALIWVRNRVRRLPGPEEEPEAKEEGPSLEERFLERLAAARDDVTATADVVRDYSAERFAVAARRMTTRELLDALGTHGVRTDPRALLEQADLVKFAAWNLAAADRGQVSDDAERFVRETREDAP